MHTLKISGLHRGLRDTVGLFVQYQLQHQHVYRYLLKVLICSRNYVITNTSAWSGSDVVCWLSSMKCLAMWVSRMRVEDWTAGRCTARHSGCMCPVAAIKFHVKKSYCSAPYNHNSAILLSLITFYCTMGIKTPYIILLHEAFIGY